MTSLTVPEVVHRDAEPHNVPRKPRLSLSRSPHPYRRLSAALLTSEERINGRKSIDEKRNLQRHGSSASSDSGTEADDERGSILKGLPAPPLRLHKGLRGSTPFSPTPAISPLPTPPLVEDETRGAYFEKPAPRSPEDLAAAEERKQTIEKYKRRRRAEVIRRTTEALLLLGVTLLVYNDARASRTLEAWRPELASYFLAITFLYLSYPFRLLGRAYWKSGLLKQSIRHSFHVPSRFDPGPLLYPVFLPCLVAISLLRHSPAFLVPNIILGLSSIPPQVVPLVHNNRDVSCLHWAVTLIPLLASSRLSGAGSVSKRFPLELETEGFVDAEVLALLCPLRMALLPTLEYLTTTSLDPSELQLLSVALVNVLLFSASPQAEILKALLWLGGLSVFIMCQKVLGWEVALARVPSWKFGRKGRSKQGVFNKLDDAFCRLLTSRGNAKIKIPVSDTETEEEGQRLLIRPTRRPRLRVEIDRLAGAEDDWRPMSAVEPHENGTIGAARGHEPLGGGKKLQRRSTFSVFENIIQPSPNATAKGRPRRSMSPNSSSFLTLTLVQAQARKWMYAGYIYLVVLLIILIPVRSYVSTRALFYHEPFGWAVGYLLGNIPQFRFWVVSNNLERWICLPSQPEFSQALCSFGWVERLRQLSIGAANSRLLLCAYCFLVISTGIAVVLQLKSVVEVDTRRKVFHGIMVAMLLPTIFVDPCFIALALGLVLAGFLLLDLFRASQLPPISKPLTHFLAPYVDGRDHRGPVIVSHIFLLIGCAIPLWLSVAGVPRAGDDPWIGWDVSIRDVSMVSGVICVGMGDAAASLVGRRYGKTKWFWGGGKSLEGSLAFVVAVVAGLMASYAWLRIGGWVSFQKSELLAVPAKAIVAGAGASLLEATLTAANDNVVVPIGLWLMVRGLGI